MYKHRITVFTPTYNRAYIITKLFTSLCKQTFKDFEWLVVDDGSTDNTEILFDEWIANSGLVIRYYKTQNGGKHRAINYGLDRAEGEIFFTVDSDDELTVDALEKVDKWFRDIESYPELCGIVANRGFTPDYTPNEIFAEQYLDKSFADMHTYCENGKKVLDGERAIIFYTSFHKQYRFPEFPGEKFLTEAVIYNRIAHDGYLVRFYNDIIWLYEYQDDGLTKAGASIYVQNPKGYGLWIKEKLQFSKYCLKERIKVYYQFTCDLIYSYDIQMIAECIGVPQIEIAILYYFHKIWRKIKGK